MTQDSEAQSITELEEMTREAAEDYREDHPVVAGYLDGVADDLAEARRMVVDDG